MTKPGSGAIMHRRGEVHKQGDALVPSSRKGPFPSLADIARNTLFEVFDCVEYVGNVPPMILVPLLKRVSAEELTRFCEHNTGADWDDGLSDIWLTHLRHHKYLPYLSEDQRKLLWDTGKKKKKTYHKLYLTLNSMMAKHQARTAAKVRQRREQLEAGKKHMRVVDIAPIPKAKKVPSNKPNGGSSKLSSLRGQVRQHARAAGIARKVPQVSTTGVKPSPARFVIKSVASSIGQLPGGDNTRNRQSTPTVSISISPKTKPRQSTTNSTSKHKKAHQGNRKRKRARDDDDDDTNVVRDGKHRRDAGDKDKGKNKGTRQGTAYWQEAIDIFA